MRQQNARMQLKMNVMVGTDCIINEKKGDMFCILCSACHLSCGVGEES